MKEIIQRALSKGVDMHVAGEFELASQLYSSVIKLDPNHADANHNMGLLKVDTDNTLEALPYLQTALQSDISIAQFWLSYIRALIKLDRTDEATKVLSLAKENGAKGREFLELDKQLNVSNNKLDTVKIELETSSQSKLNILDTLKIDKAFRLANHKVKEGLSEDAARIYNDILEKFPKNKKAQKGKATLNKSEHLSAWHGPPQEIIDQLLGLYNQGQMAEVIEQVQVLTKKFSEEFTLWEILGAAAAQTGKLNEAIIAFEKVISLRPDYADAYNNMGIALKNQGKLDQALACYHKALSLKPGYAEVYSNIGNALQKQGKLEAAAEALNKALSLKPNYIEAYNNLGNVLLDQNKPDEAIAYYNKAVSLKPDYAEAFNNIGKALMNQGKLKKALEAYQTAISYNANYAEAHDNLGRLHWLKQDFTKAFKLMEWRWKTKKQSLGTYLTSDKPSWKGEHQERVFVWKEQGIGDEIMFGSMISELDRLSKNLIIECDERLISLYKRSFSKSIKFVSNRAKIRDCEYDRQIAIASLPKYCRNKLEDFKKSSGGWLEADPDLTKRLMKKLNKKENEISIGLSWFTNSSNPLSNQRNLSTDLLAKYLQHIPAKYVNLQYGETTEELSQIKTKLGVEVIQIENLDLFNDIEGQAALISTCDVVISIDNATVHLAGALGVDTRVLLPFLAEYRWGISQSDSYWYDSLKLYRQETPGNWIKPLEYLSDDIKKIIASK